MNMHEAMFDTRLKSLGVHICQRMTYDWFLRTTSWNGWNESLVLDFGCGPSPFPCFLAGLGAKVYWSDRDESAERHMVGWKKHFGVKVTEMTPSTQVLFNTIILSNALQHNKDGAAGVLLSLRGKMAPEGRILISEKLAQGTSVWNAARKDPCWERTLGDHHRLWSSVALSVGAEAYFRYTYNENTAEETAHWTSPKQGNQIVAMLTERHP